MKKIFSLSNPFLTICILILLIPIYLIVLAFGVFFDIGFIYWSLFWLINIYGYIPILLLSNIIFYFQIRLKSLKEINDIKKAKIVWIVFIVIGIIWGFIGTILLKMLNALMSV